MKEVKPEHKVALPTDKKRRLMPKETNISGASSSSSSYRPLTDSQAIAMSDMLLSSQEAEQDWQANEVGETPYEDHANMEPMQNIYERQSSIILGPSSSSANATLTDSQAAATNEVLLSNQEAEQSWSETEGDYESSHGEIAESAEVGDQHLLS